MYRYAQCKISEWQRNIGLGVVLDLDFGVGVTPERNLSTVKLPWLLFTLVGNNDGGPSRGDCGGNDECCIPKERARS